MNLPEHSFSLSLEHNPHKDNHEEIGEYLKNDWLKGMTAEDRAECRRMDSLWTLQWYPRTQVSFYYVAGPTLERVLELAQLELQGTTKAS